MQQAKDKVQIILDTATRYFTRYGYNKTSLDEIASEARIAKGTIYYYYQSKEDIFMSVMERKAKEFYNAMIQRIESSKGFEAKLRAFLHTPVKHAYENMPILIEGLKNIPFFYRDKFKYFRKENRKSMLQLLTSILAIGKEEGLLADGTDIEKLSEVINDWFLLGDTNFEVIDTEKLLQMIERDHEMIIQMILYGIVKRG